MASKGRIVYREPNEFAANKYSYSNDNIPKNNITWQQEDFNLLVDLEVVVPNRWGYYDKTPSNNISLLQGCKLNEDYYLTTDYVNVGFSEISNNTKSNREYLGIDSIDIKFDSHFYPIVNIRFTDLRASSLFMPQEEEYKNELYQKAYENTGKEEYKENIKPYTSLFKSFFTFPYPKFLLTVKGFYGTKVTFMLSVAEFKSGLDANSGNFTIDVQFIGYLYGMYTDIPMTYLFAAPYMEDNFEESYWSKQIKNGKFKTIDGADIPTFNELYQKILQLEAPNSGLTEPLESDEIKLCNDKIGSLNQIKIAYKDLIDTFITIESIDKKGYKFEKNDKLYLIAKASDEIGVKGTTKYCFSGETYNNLGKLIDDYNKANPKEEQLTTNFYKAIIENAEFKAENGKSLYYREHGTIDKIDSSAIICGKKTQTNKTVYDTLTGRSFNIDPKKIEFLKNDEGSYNFEIINISEYLKITEKIDKYEEKKSELAAKEQKKVDYTKAVSILGFEPTIQNIMRIVFAHMDTFMHYFYELYGNIYAGKSNRVFTTINVQKEETDANIVGGENYLPPFFALHSKNENGKKINEYPGKDIRTQDIEEVTFVKRLIDSAFIVGSAFGNSERAYTSNLPTELKFSLMSDIDRFMQGVSIYTKFDGLTIGTSNGVDNVYNSFCNAVGERLYNFLNETAMYSQYGVSSNENDLFFFKDDDKTKCRQYIDYEYNMLKQELVDNLSHPVITHIYNKSKDTFKNDLVKVFDKLVSGNTVNSIVGDKYTNIINQNERLVLLPYTGDVKTVVDSFISSLSDSIGQHKYFGHIYHKLKTDNYHFNLVLTLEDNGNEHGQTITFNRNNTKDKKDYKEYTDLKNIVINSESLLYFNKAPYKNTYLYEKYNEYNKNIINKEKFAFDLLSNLVEYYLETFTDKDNNFDLSLLSNGDILVLPKFFMLYFGAILYRFKKMINDEKVFYDDKKLYEWTGFYNFKSPFNNLHGIRYVPEHDNDNNYTNDVGFYPLEFILNQEYGLNVKVNHTNDEFKKNLNNQFLNAVGPLEKIKNETTPVGKCEKLFIDFLDKNTNGITIDSIIREIKDDSFEIISIADSNYYIIKPESDLNKTMLSFISEWYVMYSNNERNQLFFLKNNSQKRDIYKNYKTTFENVAEYYYDKLQSDFGTKINNYEAKQSATKDSIINNDIGYTVYYSLKTLNDKWLCSNGKDNERWQLKSPQDTNKYKTKRFEKGEGKEESEYDSFIFVDSFFNDIGNDLIVDLPMLRKRIQDTKSVSANKEDTFTSVFQFINGIAQDNKLLFVSIPIYSNFHNDESLERIFTPNPSYASGISQGTTYVMMYTHEFSKSLGVNGYENDGFDLGNTIEEISDECGNIFSETNVGDNKINYKVPAFGVTYAMQNQNYFTNISVNMDNPQTTDYGILNTIQISQSTENGDQNSGVLIGQNIYSIYSNRSYTCTVEMLGCMNIMPMMYFQLNNIPMFKGAYMIISVSHQISGGNKMTTKFTGVRISKYLNSLLDSSSLVLKANLEQKTSTPTISYIDQFTINDESLSIYNVTEEMRHFKIEDMEKQKLNNKVVKMPDKFKENAKLLITKILDPLYDAWNAETGGKFYINSGYRVDGNINSAHDYGMAADIIADPSTIENNDKFKEFTCRWLQKNNVEFDQFIDEYSKPNTGSGWIHIGILSPGGKQRKQYKYTNYSTRPGGAKYEDLKKIYPSWFFV